ncbi:MAG: PIN domain-containing protein [Nitrospiraceae bacterium]|nr:PIN domain-containing protein [Nitrospiraceae bacterium]
MALKRRHKVFLDSNVLLSGIFSDKGAPRIILDLLTIGLPMLKGATGQYNLMEVERNLKKKMPQALPVYQTYLPKLRLEIVALPSKETIMSMAGAIAEKDIPVLASALACRAQYLITGDKKDFVRLKDINEYGLEIVGPSEFVETVFPKLINEA